VVRLSRYVVSHCSAPIRQQKLLYQSLVLCFHLLLNRTIPASRIETSTPALSPLHSCPFLHSFFPSLATSAYDFASSLVEFVGEQLSVSHMTRYLYLASSASCLASSLTRFASSAGLTGLLFGQGKGGVCSVADIVDGALILICICLFWGTERRLVMYAF